MVFPVCFRDSCLTFNLPKLLNVNALASSWSVLLNNAVSLRFVLLSEVWSNVSTSGTNQMIDQELQCKTSIDTRCNCLVKMTAFGYWVVLFTFRCWWKMVGGVEGPGVAKHCIGIVLFITNGGKGKKLLIMFYELVYLLPKYFMNHRMNFNKSCRK